MQIKFDSVTLKVKPSVKKIFEQKYSKEFVKTAINIANDEFRKEYCISGSKNLTLLSKIKNLFKQKNFCTATIKTDKNGNAVLKTKGKFNSKRFFGIPQTVDNLHGNLNKFIKESLSHITTFL